jgi:hypothetical protein
MTRQWERDAEVFKFRRTNFEEAKRAFSDAKLDYALAKAQITTTFAAAVAASGHAKAEATATFAKAKADFEACQREFKRTDPTRLGAEDRHALAEKLEAEETAKEDEIAEALMRGQWEHDTEADVARMRDAEAEIAEADVEAFLKNARRGGVIPSE